MAYAHYLLTLSAWLTWCTCCTPLSYAPKSTNPLAATATTTNSGSSRTSHTLYTGSTQISTQILSTYLSRCGFDSIRFDFDFDFGLWKSLALHMFAADDGGQAQTLAIFDLDLAHRHITHSHWHTRKNGDGYEYII